MEESKIYPLIKNKLDINRYNHTISVAKTAREIALYLRKGNNLSINNMDIFIERVNTAALLHDYAKNLSHEELMELVELAADDWQIDREELKIPQVLHAPISAYLARNELGVVDQGVLEAIRYHTIGWAEMGLLAQIIFTADFIEPNRIFTAAEVVREEFKENGLESGIIKICDFKIRHNIDSGRQLHPNTVLLRNAYLRRQT